MVEGNLRADPLDAELVDGVVVLEVYRVVRDVPVRVHAEDMVHCLVAKGVRASVSKSDSVIGAIGRQRQMECFLRQQLSCSRPKRRGDNLAIHDSYRKPPCPR